MNYKLIFIKNLTVFIVYNNYISSLPPLASSSPKLSSILYYA